MEEPTYEYDWRHPITVPNPKNKSGVSIENGSFKWFQYWLEKGCTYKQIAEHFKTSESGVSTIAILFKWKERKANHDDYLSRQREKTLITNYNNFIEKDFENADLILTGIYTLIQMAFVILNVIENPDLDIPSELTTRDALNIVKNYPKTARSIYNQILRDLQQPEHINQQVEEIIDNTPKPLSEVFKNQSTLELLDTIDFNDGP